MAVLPVCLFLSLMTVVAQSDCPCHQPSLCNVIDNTSRKEIFVFSLQNQASHWEKFDWKKLTTVVTVGYVSADLMCLAHQHGARVVTIANYKLSELTNATLRTQWVKKQLSIVQSSFYDGINIDFEEPIGKNDSVVRAAYSALVKETFDTFKQANPHYQVTVDVAWSPNCIDGRCYDIRGLAQNTDFLFVMAYDEQSQIFGDRCVALANSDYVKTERGLEDYLKQEGLRPDQLVLGVPWYGYNYPCLSLSQDNVCSIRHVHFRGVNCSDAVGSQIDLHVIDSWLANHTSWKRQWDKTAQSPFFNFEDPATGQMHQVRYDDPVSLRIKYSLAMSLDLRGVGTWNIDCLDFSSTPFAQRHRQEMFDALPHYPTIPS
ncbi:di-N-acetylchitobiase-like [Babylonia areolata]|uniref:di-N-acetylchitobiase-like n=1 Tax=Babylonia areolata TaxID=304850 RepID=UPI003FD4A0AE